MARVCTVCAHKRLDEINKALLNDAPNRRIAAQFNLSEASVRRHKSEHLPARLAQAQEAHEVVQADTLLARLLELNRETQAILREARADGTKDNELALRAIARAEKQLELEAKLLGELNEGTTVHLHVSAEWIQLRAVILQALTPYPDAVKAVERALHAPE